MKSASRTILWLAGWIALLVLLLLVAVLVSNTISKGRLDRYRTELEARGESFSPVELGPPKAAAENNGGPEAIRVGMQFKGLSKPPFVDVSLGGPSTSRGANFAQVLHKLDTVTGPTSPISWEQLAAAMTPMQGLLAELRQTTLRPELSADVDYSRGVRYRLDFTEALQPSVSFLLIDALVNLHQGNATTASVDVVTAIRLSQMLDQHPSLIGQALYGRPIATIQSTTWEILQSDSVTAADLEILQDAWEGVDLIKGLVPTLRMYRALLLPTFNEPISEFSALLGSVPAGSLIPSADNAKSTLLLATWASLYRHSDQHQFMEDTQTFIDGVVTLEGQGGQPILKLAQQIDDSIPNASPTRLVSVMMQPNFTSLTKTTLAQEAMKNLTVAAIAIRRYQLDHAGSPPPDLASLVPHYLVTLPTDPFVAQPLRYNPNAINFPLYSVGVDGTDDGGYTGGSHIIYKRKDIAWPRALSSPSKAQKAP